MDGDLGAKLESVLSDPDQMQKLTQMAMSMMGQTTPAVGATEETQTAEAEAAAVPIGDTKLLSALGKAFSGGKGKTTRSTALLTAMRPYMRPEKQEKLDRAMKIARMVNIAGMVLREYGGSGDGI